MGESLFTWESLSAIGGASLLTFFIVQYTKGLVDQIMQWLPTDVYAVVVSFFILIVAQLAKDADWTDWKLYVLSLANAFLVAAAAGQMHQKVLSPPGSKLDRKK